MPVFQRPVAIARQTVPVRAIAPYRQPAYVAPRTVYRDRTITRNIYTPGVTRNIYNTTYVNRGMSPGQRSAFESGIRTREFERLMREGRWSREQAQAQAAAIAAQQAAAAQAAQAATANAQAQSAAGLQPAPTSMAPTAAVSPGSAEADLGPAQDQAADDAGGGAPEADEHAHKPHHMLLLAGIVVAAGAVGYMALKKKKTGHKAAD